MGIDFTFYVVMSVIVLLVGFIGFAALFVVPYLVLNFCTKKVEHGDK